MNWRTINIDLLDPESSANFSITSLLPALPQVSASEVQTLAGQIRQLLRGGDAEGALRGALENAPYGGDAQAKVCYSLNCDIDCSQTAAIPQLPSLRSTTNSQTLGNPRRHPNRNPPINQSLRNVSPPFPHLRLPLRPRNPRRPHEISLQRNVPISLIIIFRIE